MYSCWIGSTFLKNHRVNERTHLLYDTGSILAIVFAFKMGLLLLMTLSPNVQAVVKARIVGRMVFDVLDRVPEIRDKEGAIVINDGTLSLDSGIHFKNVAFKYPTALPQLPNVLNGVDFTIKAGSTTAIVGPSGSGKSTIIQMVERFYDPLSGDIFFD
jgi:ABC-type multidrug transport system fused ATPase/permease subunit